MSSRGRRTVCSGDELHGPGPALLGRHAHLDHDLLLQLTRAHEHRRQRREAEEECRGLQSAARGGAGSEAADRLPSYLHRSVLTSCWFLASATS